MKAHSRSFIISLTLVIEEGGWLRPHSGRFTPGKETRSPLHRRLCGLQGRSGRVRKISSLTGIRCPDRPVHSETLYRLSCPDPRYSMTNINIYVKLIHLILNKSGLFEKDLSLLLLCNVERKNGCERRSGK